MKYIAPSYLRTAIESKDVITASTGNGAEFEVTQSGTTSTGNKIYDAIVDINDYLTGLGK